MTLTATVNEGGVAVHPGQVNFCDDSAPYCTDVHLLGSAQLRSDGTAIWSFRPAPGTHDYKAVFVGTNALAASSSTSATLAVTISSGQYPAATLISSTGSWGSYSLTATVEKFGGTSPLTGDISFEDTSNGNAVLATTPLASSTPGLFWAPQVPCTSAPGPTNIVAADLNGDGYLDYVTLQSQLNAVYIFVYQPTLGCYQQVASYSTGNAPSGIVVSDFNSDGYPDIAVANAGSNTVTILLGRGDGSFTASAVTAGLVNTALVAADFNGDGIPDLAVANEFSGSVAILLGKGDGTFTAAFTLAASPAQSLAAGDFNGDGNIDLAVPESTGVGIFTGNGDGTFNAASTVTVPGNLSLARVIAGDFNGDGNLDLAVSTGTNVVPNIGQVTVLLGNGHGAFMAASSSTIPNAALQIAVADFNLDGIPDIAALDIAGTISVLTGKGDGTFNSPPYTATAEEFSADQGFAVGDMDGDGRPDILYSAAYPPNYVYVYFGLTKPTETASTAPIAISPSGVGQHQVVASYPGDANATSDVSNPVTLWGMPPATSTNLALTVNGSPVSTVSSGTAVTLTASVTTGGTALTMGQVNFCDATVSSCTDIHLLGSAQLLSNGTAVLRLTPPPGTHSYRAVLTENGYGALSKSGVVTLTVNQPAASPIPTVTAIAQSGSTGNYTLTATVSEAGSAAAPTGTVSFLDTSYSNQLLETAQLGSATPGLVFPLSYSYPQSNVGYMLQAVGDFNGDGKQDIAAINSSVESIDILLGNGDGTFSSAPSLATPIYPYAIAVADFNHDGKLDIAVATPQTAVSSPGQLLIYLGNGDGTFTAAPGPQTFPGASNALFVADVNGDGKLDIVIGGSDNTQILLGNGDGTFASPIAVGSSGAVAVGDLNGDSIPDLILGYNTSTPSVYLGKGDGTFSANGFTFPGITGTGPAVIADFNGDGIPDVGIAGLFYSPVQVFLGKGDGTFTAVSSSANPSINEPSSIVVADLNRDGKPDLIVTNVNSYSGNTMNPDLTFMLGNGDGTFTSITGDTQLNGTWSVFAADFNGDGTPDLSVGTGNGISVLLTEPTQTVTATTNGVAPSGPGPHLVDASYPGDANFKSSASGTTSLLVQAPTPAVSPAGGTYTTIQNVTITDSVPGATIYYTTDGSTPIVNPAPYQTASPIYTGPIAVGSHTETISAIAVATGYQASNMTQTAYQLNLTPPVAPVLSLASGYYPSSQTLNISDTTPGASIYYSTNGSTLTTSYKPYTGPITVAVSETVVAIATYGYTSSPAVAAQYFIGNSQSSFIYTVAGNESWGYGGDGGPATVASLNHPSATAVDRAGNLYIADSGNNVVRKVAAGTGVITTVAGTEVAGYSGDNGPAANATLSSPEALAVNSAGDLYVADAGNRVVRMVAASTGTITTVAGSSTATSVGDNGPATSAQLASPFGLAFDVSGNLYIADSTRVRAVSASTGIITTVAGNGSFGYAGDNGPATSASLSQSEGIAVDGAGNLYIADTGNNAIRKVTANTGVITTVAGTGPTYTGSYFSGDGGPATSAHLFFPRAVALDAAGNLYIADSENMAVREVASSNGIINTIAGNPPLCSSLSGDGGTAIDSAICYPTGITLDGAGNLYVAENGWNRIRKVTLAALPSTAVAAAPVFNLPAGTYTSPPLVNISSTTPGAAIYLTLNGAAPTTSGEGYHGPITITGSATLQAVAVAPGFLPSPPVTATYTLTTPPTATVSTFATLGGAGSAGPTANAESPNPNGLAIDGAGNLYVADPYSSVIWTIAAKTGAISVAAGMLGTEGNGGNGGPATSAFLAYPSHVAIDPSGNLYIADTNNNVVRKVDMQTGIISAFAGGAPFSGNLGDGGPATSAFLDPQGLAFDSAGNLYIADESNNRIRMVSATTGIISTVAGGATNNMLGDGGPATSATLFYPQELAFDSHGNLYISEVGDGRVRVVNAATQTISTVAGNGDNGESGDGGLASSAEVSCFGLALDGAGNLYLANSPNEVRMVPPGGGLISTVAGSGYTGFSSDGGSATMAEFCGPTGLVFDKSGNLYIADSCNYRVRKVTFSGATATPSFSLASGTYDSAQTLTISDETEGAAIYYTTDGSTPTSGSTMYNSPVVVSSTETVNAIALATGYTVSAVASAAFVINGPVAPAIPTVTATPATSTVGTQASLSVTVAVNGGMGAPVATGSVVLTSGSYASAPTPLSAGSTMINVPAGQLAVGSDTLTATYTPDSSSSSIYNSAIGSAPVTVVQAIGSCATSNPNPNPNPESFAVVQDFNGDCKSDILWRNTSTEQVYLWLMNGVTLGSSGSPGSPTSDWVIQGVGDFNGDGKADILWRNTSTEQVYLWLMNGAAMSSSGSLGYVSSNWTIQGIGDFNGDGKADILWRNSTTGQVYIWLMNGTTMTGGGSVNYVSSDWSIQGVGDFNGDGKADILWRNSTTGQVYIWLMNGTTISGGGSVNYVSSNWSIQGVGDFNGDGTSDILWRDSTTGQVYVWLMNGATISGGGSVNYVSSNWSIQGVGDYDGSGRAGILWRNSSTEQVYIWLLNGTTITSTGSPGTPDATWQIAP